MGATEDVVDALIRLFELDAVFGLAALSTRREQDVLALTRAYTRIGEVLGIDWAQQQISAFTPSDQWERLLVAGLARDFEQLRLDFLSRTRGDDSEASVERWVKENPKRIAQFRSLVERARVSGGVTLPMLSQIASQARVLLAR
jgi:glutamate dehydrogenase